MKKYKQFIIGLIVGAMLFSIGTVFADTQTIEAFFNNIKISIDGNIVELKDAAGNPVQPFIYNGTTNAPIRAIAEALGMEVKYNETTNTIELTKVKEVLKLEELHEKSPRATASILEQNPEVRDTIDENGYAVWKGKPVRLNKDYLDGKVKIELEEDVTTVVEPNKSPVIYTSDGIRSMTFNDAGEYSRDGKYYYIDTYQIAKKYENKFNYKTGVNETGFSFLYANFSNNDQFSSDAEKNKTMRLYNFYSKEPILILENIPNIKGQYIPIDYYETHILPLLK